MKIEHNITFEEYELNALKTLANIDCFDLNCEDCPLYVADKRCVRGSIRRILDGNNISW